MKIPHDNISEELLARYFNQTASESERDQVSAWAERSPENTRDLEAFRILWESAGKIGQKIQFDEDAAWKKVRQKMIPLVEKEVYPNIPDTASEKVVKHLPVKRTKSIVFWAAAVIAAALVTFGWMQLKQESGAEQLSLATGSNVKETYLPDGTKVFLNHNSEITYPQNFTGDIRGVSLKGEAFFDVKPDSAHPFVIQANGTEIRVLGTSFNVKAYAKDPVRVDVATGTVLVRNASSEIKLTKGQSAQVLRDTVRSIIPDANIMGYRTHVFDFHATSLNDVVSTIRNGYHADVRLSGDQLAKCRLTIRFEKEPLDVTLSVIAETMELKLRQEGETYWLDGAGCP